MLTEIEGVKRKINLEGLKNREGQVIESND